MPAGGGSGSGGGGFSYAPGIGHFGLGGDTGGILTGGLPSIIGRGIGDILRRIGNGAGPGSGNSGSSGSTRRGSGNDPYVIYPGLAGFGGLGGFGGTGQGLGLVNVPGSFGPNIFGAFNGPVPILPPQQAENAPGTTGGPSSLPPGAPDPDNYDGAAAATQQARIAPIGYPGLAQRFDFSTLGRFAPSAPSTPYAAVSGRPPQGGANPYMQNWFSRTQQPLWAGFANRPQPNYDGAAAARAAENNLTEAERADLQKTVI